MQPMNDGAFTRGELMIARMVIATRRAVAAVDAFVRAWDQATDNIRRAQVAELYARKQRIDQAIEAVERHERMRHASGR